MTTAAISGKAFLLAVRIFNSDNLSIAGSLLADHYPVEGKILADHGYLTGWAAPGRSSQPTHL